MNFETFNHDFSIYEPNYYRPYTELRHLFLLIVLNHFWTVLQKCRLRWVYRATLHFFKSDWIRKCGAEADSGTAVVNVPAANRSTEWLNIDKEYQQLKTETGFWWNEFNFCSRYFVFTAWNIDQFRDVALQRSRTNHTAGRLVVLNSPRVLEVAAK